MPGEQILTTQPKRQLSIQSINLEKVARGSMNEFSLFNRTMRYLLDRFPMDERTPLDEFQRGARQHANGTLGGSSKNKLYCAAAMDGREIVGGVSAVYVSFTDESFLYIGAWAASVQQNRRPAGALLLKNAVKFARQNAKAEGKPLSFILSETETRESAASDAEYAEHSRFLSSRGMQILDSSCGFRYFQPAYSGGIPLDIAIKPLHGAISRLKHDKVESIVRAIYSLYYDGFTKGRKFLQAVIDSIPADGVPLKKIEAQN